jgi:aspartate ammonia-lyase
MQIAWNVDGTAIGTRIDYSGNYNMAVWARWQNFSQSAETVSLIPNLIFTDNAASAVVGTKGVLGPMNAAPSGAVQRRPHSRHTHSPEN